MWWYIGGIGLAVASFLGGVAVGIYVERAGRRAQHWD